MDQLTVYRSEGKSMLDRLNLIDILYSLPAIFLAFSFHEFAHAFVAYRMGDATPKLQGRLTLDPLAHVDWIGLIMFAIFGFGWAKPVQVNPSNFRNRKWGDILVALAGPLANILLAFLALLIVQILSYSSNLNSGMAILLSILYKIVSLNIVFAFLNLIPVPPFDGYKIVKNLFFRKNIKFFWLLERYSIIILFAMILLNVFSFLIRIPYSFTYKYLDRLTAWIVALFF